MKKRLIGVGLVASLLLLTGCGETLGKLMMKTGMTPDMKIVSDQKKVDKRIKNIYSHTIISTKLKPISKDKVVVFRETNTPKYCKEMGWILIDDPKAFREDRYEDYETEAIKEKAAKLGFNTVNVGGMGISELENLTKYVGPYKWIGYIITKNKITVYAYEYKQKCSKKAEKQCKISSKGDKNKYYACLMNCSYKEGHKMTVIPIHKFWVKALMCDEKFLNKIRKGETIIGAEMDMKASNLKNTIQKKLDEHNKKSRIKIKFHLD